MVDYVPDCLFFFSVWFLGKSPLAIEQSHNSRSRSEELENCMVRPIGGINHKPDLYTGKNLSNQLALPYFFCFLCSFLYLAKGNYGHNEGINCHNFAIFPLFVVLSWKRSCFWYDLYYLVICRSQRMIFVWA